MLDISLLRKCVNLPSSCGEIYTCSSYKGIPDVEVGIVGMLISVAVDIKVSVVVIETAQGIKYASMLPPSVVYMRCNRC